jgi:hypothetical protein
MEEEKLGRLLSELGERTAEPARTGLAEEIKQQIPYSLVPHKHGMDTINIIVDLRVSKLAAAAAIIVTLILLANFHGLYEDSRLLASYLLGGAGRGNISAARKEYEILVNQGKEVVFYESIDPEDNNSIRMHWKLPNGKYRVVFGGLQEEEVSAEELIRLQARMLQKKRK